MTVRTGALGKAYPPTVYAVGREKVREYALAVGETNPVHLDVQAARPRRVCRHRRSTDVRSRLLDAGGSDGGVRPGRGDELRDGGPRRPGVSLGPAGHRRRDRQRASVKDIYEHDGAGSTSLRLFRSTSVARPSAPAHGQTSSEAPDEHSHSARLLAPRCRLCPNASRRLQRTISSSAAARYALGYPPGAALRAGPPRPPRYRDPRIRAF